MGITESMLSEVGEKLYKEALVELPQDVTVRLREMQNEETSEIAKFKLDYILKNADMANSKRGVVCQDTGISSYKVKIGTNAKIDGDIVNVQ